MDTRGAGLGGEAEDTVLQVAAVSRVGHHVRELVHRINDSGHGFLPAHPPELQVVHPAA